MKIVVATLKSVSPYSQSRYHDTPHLEKESHNDYEVRTWRERLNYTSDGRVFIPAMAFKKALDSAASFLSMKIKGRKNQTYTKHFKAGVLVTEGLVLPHLKDEVPGETLFVPSDGKSGGGSRVKKTFPVIQQWEGDVTFYILDDTITEEVFEQHLREAGNFIGLGRFRPEKGGFYGRFTVEKITWSEQRAAA